MNQINAHCPLTTPNKIVSWSESVATVPNTLCWYSAFCDVTGDRSVGWGGGTDASVRSVNTPHLTAVGSPVYLPTGGCESALTLQSLLTSSGAAHTSKYGISRRRN